MVAVFFRAKLLIESGYGGVSFRSEVDACLYCEMLDDCVVHHEAVGVLAVTRFRMFTMYTG